MIQSDELLGGVIFGVLELNTCNVLHQLSIGGFLRGQTQTHSSLSLIGFTRVYGLWTLEWGYPPTGVEASNG